MGYLTEEIDWWNEKLTPNQIIWDREYRDNLKWHEVSKMQNMTADYIREFQNELDWKILTKNHSIDERTLEEFWDRIDWKDILARRDFSEEFLKKHKYDLDWKRISYFQDLSEQFCNEMENYIVWDQFNPNRSRYYSYSNDFKLKHWDQMETWRREGFWQEKLEIEEVNGEKRIVKIKYNLNIDAPVEREYI